MKPLYEYVIIKPIVADITKKSGMLYVPETAKDDKVQKGLVVAVGDGMMTVEGNQIPPTVAVGDLVLYWKHTAQDLEFEGEACVILRESPDILAYLRKGEK
jgi:chaperonin GroES